MDFPCGNPLRLRLCVTCADAMQAIALDGFPEPGCVSSWFKTCTDKILLELRDQPEKPAPPGLTGLHRPHLSLWFTQPRESDSVDAYESEGLDDEPMEADDAGRSLRILQELTDVALRR